MRTLGKAFGTAALLNLTACIVYVILDTLFSRNPASLDAFVTVAVLLTLYFPVLLLFYWIIFLTSSCRRWITTHSKGFPISLVAAGCGMGLTLWLPWTSIKLNIVWVWLLILISLTAFLYGLVITVPLSKQLRASKIFNSAITLILVIGFIGVAIVPEMRDEVDNLLLVVGVDFSISPYLVWTLLGQNR